MSKGLTIYFVRHGETFFNKNARTQGWCDPQLTPEGIQMVKDLGKSLSKVKFDAAIVSDLKRTRTTAEIIIEQSSYPNWMIPIKEMADFREISFGSFEGMESYKTWDILRTYLDFDSVEDMLKNTTEKQRLMTLRYADPLGQGEDYTVYCKRLKKGIDKLLEELIDTEACVLFVGHSINIRHILQFLLPKTEHIDEFYNMRSMSNGGVVIIQEEADGFKLKQFMDKTFD
ncbi:histidine phosphatase family protein [Facklamia sp. 7083-14-GEN3]|uniref:histidine phosphatase family protein n=1 Tax=Facklamia sp. 7083-14-GEN3 TaxID=2973478 RepID=UPI00215C69A4|nr:histidine phosphatase family protein [Facklamia sp. 7083-14-GEN3]MCR8969376.1 histidine phosphatase family protein [Facklamia sp. 7083-14-GEN3]